MNKMTPRKPLTLSIIIAVILISALMLWSSELSARPLHFQQTWPSRTPTPSSNPPTNTPSGGQPTSGPPGGEPGQGTEQPPGGDTGTPAAGVTPVAIAPTPIGGYLPTAESCGVPPSALALGAVNVREGPGLDYDVISIMVYLEVRSVVGRAAEATWWVIELADASIGWVFDQAVVLSGYTGQVPIVPAPDIDGDTPTPGSPWQPTPNPVCTPPPTPTEEPTSSATPIVRVTEVVPSTETATVVVPTATETSQPTSTSTPVPTETPEPTGIPDTPTFVPITGVSLEESTTDTEEGSNAVTWLLVGSLGLIAAGLALSFARRRFS